MVEKDVKKTKTSATTKEKAPAPAEKNKATTTTTTTEATTTAPATATAAPAKKTTTDTKGLFSFDFAKTPITKVADEVIIAASNKGSSDIHFDPREDGMMVRFRVDGELQDYTFIPKTYERNLTTRLKLLANMNITESRLPQDGAIKGDFGGKYLDMRVSCLPLNEGEKVVIRILDYTRSLQGIDSLGFNKTNLGKLKRMMGVPNGIILVTGATGSGKSTTTYSILQGLNKPEVNIITVEDPIEMNIEGMNQVQVNSEIGMTFAAALRSILRQDPNVILIGEIRDSETAQIAVRASITGHLVLSTIHTNNSLATIERLLDMDVERYLLSTALTGIISQRLAKQLCMHCRIKRPTTKYEQKVFRRYMSLAVDEIYDANEKGCEHCRRGYKGRIAIQEVLELDEDIRNALTNEKLKKEDLKDMVYTNKTITMLQDALGKALAGLTSFDEVYRVIEIESDWDEEESDLTSSLDSDKDIALKQNMAMEAMEISLGEGMEELKPVEVRAVAPLPPEKKKEKKKDEDDETHITLHTSGVSIISENTQQVGGEKIIVPVQTVAAAPVVTAAPVVAAAPTVTAAPVVAAPPTEVAPSTEAAPIVAAPPVETASEDTEAAETTESTESTESTEATEVAPVVAAPPVETTNEDTESAEVTESTETTEVAPLIPTTPVEDTSEDTESTETTETAESTEIAPIVVAPPSETPEEEESEDKKYNVVVNPGEYTDPYNIPAKMIISDNSTYKPEPAADIPLAEPITTTPVISDAIETPVAEQDVNINNVVDNINQQKSNALQNIINPATPTIIANLPLDNNSIFSKVVNSKNHNVKRYDGFVLPPLIPIGGQSIPNPTQNNQTNEQKEQNNNNTQLIVPKFTNN